MLKTATWRPVCGSLSGPLTVEPAACSQACPAYGLPLGRDFSEVQMTDPSIRMISMRPVSNAPTGANPRWHPAGLANTALRLGALASFVFWMRATPEAISVAALRAAKFASSVADLRSLALDWT
jgi:hypothetical protein